jgi:hypothetical protein
MRLYTNCQNKVNCLTKLATSAVLMPNKFWLITSPNCHTLDYESNFVPVALPAVCICVIVFHQFYLVTDETANELSNKVNCLTKLATSAILTPNYCFANFITELSHFGLLVQFSTTSTGVHMPNTFSRVSPCNRWDWIWTVKWSQLFDQISYFHWPHS